MDSIKIVGAAVAAIVLGMGLPIGVLTAFGPDDGEHGATAHKDAPADDSANYLRTAIDSTVKSVGAAHAQGEAQLANGETLYASCVACHKDQGQGDYALKSPALAGQEDWYILAQLKKFKSGIRGKHPEDLTGMQMVPLMALLPGDAEMNAVAQYLASKPFVKQPAQLSGGDAEKGKASYALCLACHGPNGEGNPTLKSPAIAGQADWYILSQLQKFKAGIRGYHEKDIEGKQMAPITMALADEQTMIDLATYIHGMR